MEIEQTPQGYWVICGETHLNRWVRETGRLDHDMCLIPLACSHIIEGSIAIDVGANIGDHTIAYLQACGLSGIVVAYEPHEDAFRCLALNCPSAICLQRAVGSECGKANLVHIKDNVGSSFLSYSEGDPVNISTLDYDFSADLAPKVGKRRISFIKIDVEGCELEVLIGGEKLISQHHPVILLELNYTMMKKRGHHRSEVLKFMLSHNYCATLYPETNTWESPQTELLCLPK